MKILIAVNGKVGDTNISFDSFDVDFMKNWVCKQLKLNPKDYKMKFHLVPSFKIDLVHEPQQKEEVKPSEKEEAKTRKVEIPTQKKEPKVKKSSTSQRRKDLRNKRISAKALAKRKAQEVIEREKKCNEDMAKRAKEAEETKKKYHQPKAQNEPTMLELVTAKVENIHSGNRLNPNPQLGFTVNNKLTKKIKKLHELLLEANLIEKNSTGKIFTLREEATAEKCINFIEELGDINGR